jgi:hypothetical protein
MQARPAPRASTLVATQNEDTSDFSTESLENVQKSGLGHGCIAVLIRSAEAFTDARRGLEIGADGVLSLR